MQVMVRLYRQHDMDLIELYLTKGFKFQKYLKEAYLSYVRGEDYCIPLPKNKNIKEGYLKKSVAMHFTLNNEDDADAVMELKEMKNGMRNSFFKALFRKSLSDIPLSSYKKGDGIIISRDEAFRDLWENEHPHIRGTTTKENLSEDVDIKQNITAGKELCPVAEAVQNRYDNKEYISRKPDFYEKDDVFSRTFTEEAISSSVIPLSEQTPKQTPRQTESPSEQIFPTNEEDELFAMMESLMK